MKAAWMMPMPGPQIHRQSGRALPRKTLISPVSLALGGSCGLDFAFVPRGRGADASIDGLAMPMSGICRLVCVLGPLRNNKLHVCVCVHSMYLLYGIATPRTVLLSQLRTVGFSIFPERVWYGTHQVAHALLQCMSSCTQYIFITSACDLSWLPLDQGTLLNTGTATSGR